MENKKKIILSIVMILLLIIVTIGVTYAAFTFSKQGNVENTLETGTVTLTYTEGKTGITLNEAYPMSDEKGKVLVGENNVFDFTVQANLSRTMSIGYEVTAVKIPITDVTPLEDDEVKLYLERAIDPDTNYSEVFAPSHYVPRDEQTEIGSPVGSMILDSGTFTNAGITIHNYRLRMWIDENAIIPSGESRKYGVKINVYAKQDIYATPVEQPKNENITAIYQYNQNKESDTFCVTGEENTCVKLTKRPEIYEAGTIIKYKVNDSEEKYFFVVSDNGDTLTMQQRENIGNSSWYSVSSDNTKGPLTALSFLENATAGWSNVLDQTYQMGTTVFKGNAYTGCGYDHDTYVIECEDYTYTLPTRTAKARMLTTLEAQELGCLAEYYTCPIWMHNFLNGATNAGGTHSGSSPDYWLMNSVSYSTNNAWRIFWGGGFSAYEINVTYSYGVRPVIMISK